MVRDFAPYVSIPSTLFALLIQWLPHICYTQYEIVVSHPSPSGINLSMRGLCRTGSFTFRQKERRTRV
jgi:hypothetical protein